MPDVRRTACHILNRLEQQTETLDQILTDVFETLDIEERKDRSLVHALVFGVIRWKRKLDYVIDCFSKTRLNKIDPEILMILRLGTFQILFMDRIPDSAAVNTAVELGKSARKPWIGKYINGLLRNIARNKQALKYPSPTDDPVSHLAVSHAMPDWLIRRLLNRYPYEEVVSICTAANTIPPITVRTNTLKTNRDTLCRTLSKEANQVEITRHSPLGIRLTSPLQPIFQFRSFATGDFQVQDEAAQLVSILAGPRPGQRVLDACAGLGGKTGHLAQTMNNQGHIVALDSNAVKLGKLVEEMQRLGIGIVETRRHNLEKPLDRSVGEFDRILLDAPCSGLGVIRRNPDSKWDTARRDLIPFQQRQLRFLTHLTDRLKPGGSLTYAVCSTEPEETRDVVNRFLQRFPDFQLEDRTCDLPETLVPVIYSDRMLTTCPHRDDMDGFFAVCFRKSSG